MLLRDSEAQEVTQFIRQAIEDWEVISDDRFRWVFEDSTKVDAQYVTKGDREGWGLLVSWSWGDESTFTVVRPQPWGRVLNIVASSIRASQDYALEEPLPEVNSELTIGDDEFDQDEWEEYRRAKQDFDRVEERATSDFNRGVKQTPNNPCEAYPWVHHRETEVLYDYQSVFPEGELIDGATLPTSTDYYEGVEPDSNYITISVSHLDSTGQYPHGVIPNWLTYAEYRENAPGHRISPDTQVKIVRNYTVLTVSLTNGGAKPRHVRSAGYDMPAKSNVPGYGSLCTGQVVESGEKIVFDGREITAVENSDDVSVPRTTLGGVVESSEVRSPTRIGHTLYKKLCEHYGYEGAPQPEVASAREFDLEVVAQHTDSNPD